LLNERNKDLQYREKRIEILKKKRKGLQQRLQQVQQQAADNELSGMGLSANLQSRLQAAQQELDNNQSSIQQLQTEIDTLNMQYELDRQRLGELLGTAAED
jgi:predicted  nucleic acid-binding Zn-ribbon protein